MSKVSTALVGTALVSALGCHQPDHRDMAPGTEVTIEMPDGSLVTGTVAGATAEHEREATPVADMTRPPLEGRPPGSEAALEPELAPEPAPEPDVATVAHHTETTVPAGTRLSLTLDTGLASDLNRVDDPIQARIDRAVTVDDIEAIPAGSLVHGAVTSATPSGKVRGRAQLSFRFENVDIGDVRYDVRSETLWYRAESTQTEDATKIGIGAGAGALIGGLIGGGRGAGTGAVVGGGAGTAMVLTTAGQEVEIRRGTRLEVELEEPLVVRSPLSATD